MLTHSSSFLWRQQPLSPARLLLSQLCELLKTRTDLYLCLRVNSGIRLCSNVITQHPKAQDVQGEKIKIFKVDWVHIKGQLESF